MIDSLNYLSNYSLDFYQISYRLENIYLLLTVMLMYFACMYWYILNYYLYCLYYLYQHQQYSNMYQQYSNMYQHYYQYLFNIYISLVFYNLLKYHNFDNYLFLKQQVVKFSFKTNKILLHYYFLIIFIFNYNYLNLYNYYFFRLEKLPLILYCNLKYMFDYKLDYMVLLNMILYFDFDKWVSYRMFQLGLNMVQLEVSIFLLGYKVNLLLSLCLHYYLV